MNVREVGDVTLQLEGCAAGCDTLDAAGGSERGDVDFVQVESAGRRGAMGTEGAVQGRLHNDGGGLAVSSSGMYGAFQASVVSDVRWQVCIRRYRI